MVIMQEIVLNIILEEDILIKENHMLHINIEEVIVEVDLEIIILLIKEEVGEMN